MKKLNLLICAVLFFSCSKNVHEQTKTEPDVAVVISNAFKFAINLDSKKKQTNNQIANKISKSDVLTDNIIIEERALSNLSESYGQEIYQSYYDNKENCTPDFTKYESLQDISLEGVDETNVKEFITKVFSSAKSKIKSANLRYSAQNAMQKEVSNLMEQIADSAQSLAMNCIDGGALDESKIKSNLLATVTNFKGNANLEDLNPNEKETLLNSIAMLENSISTFVDYGSGLTNPMQKSALFSIGFNANKGWLKDLVKFVVKCVVVTVCLIGGTFAGFALGAAICANPDCATVGAVAGFVGGCYAASAINKWVSSW